MRGSGDSWWHERRDDMAVLSMKIRACELNAANATRLGRRVGCFIQRSKLRARRRLTGMAKNAVQFAVEQFFAYREALTVGPNGTSHTRTAIPSPLNVHVPVYRRIAITRWSQRRCLVRSARF